MSTESGQAGELSEITPAMIEAGVAYVRDFFPGAWSFPPQGISEGEASLLVTGLLKQLLPLLPAPPRT